MNFVAKTEKDVWQTPGEILGPIQEHMNIDLDPCAGENTNIGDRNYRPPEDNGLELAWNKRFKNNDITVFMNPPFSKKVEFIKKALNEYKSNNVQTVFILTPDSTDVKSWWHNLIAKNCPYTYFPKGRVNYVDPQTQEVQTGVSFGSAISILGPIPNELEQYYMDNGDFVIRKNLYLDMDMD